MALIFWSSNYGIPAIEENIAEPLISLPEADCMNDLLRFVGFITINSSQALFV
jgi:hypothetical protein